MSEPRYVEVEGDKPKVERTRQYFSALRAGLKTAEEVSYELEHELGAPELMLKDERRWRAEAEAERDRLAARVSELEAALRDGERIASQYMDTGRGDLDGWAEHAREFIAHTLDEYGDRMPSQWKAHARAAIAGEQP